MTDLRLSVTIDAESRGDLVYWLGRLIETVRDHPESTSGRSSGGGVLDWSIAPRNAKVESLRRGRALSSAEVREQVIAGRREFWDRCSGSWIRLVGYDLDDGCTGYAECMDRDDDLTDSYLLVDLSCLNESLPA